MGKIIGIVAGKSLNQWAEEVLNKAAHSNGQASPLVIFFANIKELPPRLHYLMRISFARKGLSGYWFFTVTLFL
jgi:hypothetical protein